MDTDSYTSFDCAVVRAALLLFLIEAHQVNETSRVEASHRPRCNTWTFRNQKELLPGPYVAILIILQAFVIKTPSVSIRRCPAILREGRPTCWAMSRAAVNSRLWSKKQTANKHMNMSWKIKKDQKVVLVRLCYRNTPLSTSPAHEPRIVTVVETMILEESGGLTVSTGADDVKDPTSPHLSAHILGTPNCMAWPDARL